MTRASSPQTASSPRAKTAPQSWSDSDGESVATPSRVQKRRKEDRKPRSKPASSAAGCSAAGSKRKATKIEGKTSFKKSRKEEELKPSVEGIVGEKKTLIKRFWSEDDEILMLKGMLDFARKGGDPIADASAFYESINNSLRSDGTKTQVMGKLKRLKKKFKNISKRVRKGKEPFFSKPHAEQVYALSKQIWGSTEDPKKKMEEIHVIKEDSLVSKRCLNGMLSICRSTGVVGLEESVAKKALQLFGDDKKALLEKRWRDVEMSKLALFVKQTELLSDQARLMLEAYRSGSSSTS